MFGVPDRSAAMVYYWFFVLAASALPMLPLATPLVSQGLALVGSAYSVFALWSTARAIRWLDREGWHHLR
jgi:hypothetical protein